MVRQNNGQTDILDFLDENEGWFTTKEIHAALGEGQISSLNRCLRKLSEFKFVIRDEIIRTNYGKEYRYISTKWVKENKSGLE